MDNQSDDEVSNCPECDGQGSFDKWMAVAGHYEGGEVFRLRCDHCDGTGMLARHKAPNVGAMRRDAAGGTSV